LVYQYKLIECATLKAGGATALFIDGLVWAVVLVPVFTE
jgi:hypothetical protein